MTTRIVELRRGILKKNDELAAGLRGASRGGRRAGAEPGFQPRHGQDRLSGADAARSCARGARWRRWWAILETDNDARRLAASGAPVRQINTHGICHLDAEMIGKHLDGWEGVALAGLDYLFIENVGNLVCPSSYDLGERFAWPCSA
jgi:hydrogenase nickel incorporation protein HypB